MASDLEQFIQTIATLRGVDGCPWDKVQTHETLARYLLEESYEVLEAIHLNNPDKLCEELGDLLLQIVLNAQIAKDNGQFDIEDIAKAINTKMIERHPHVFGESKLDSPKQVVKQWEELKQNNKSSASAMYGITATLPALLKALKVSEKAVAHGFEWQNEEEIWQKLESELNELKEAIASPNEEDKRRNIDLELGDVLFTLVNIARWQKLNPEESLLLSIDKFKKRFSTMEEISKHPLKELSYADLYKLWQEAKKICQ